MLWIRRSRKTKDKWGVHAIERNICVRFRTPDGKATFIGEHGFAQANSFLITKVMKDCVFISCNQLLSRFDNCGKNIALFISNLLGSEAGNFTEIGSWAMFDGKNNELLDNIYFRMGVHTVLFWGWVAMAIFLLSR